MTVRNIMKALKETKEGLDIVCENLTPFIQEDVYFTTARELEDRFPDLTPREREYEIVEQYRTVFLVEIGDTLNNRKERDRRTPGYDDWALDGDTLLYYPMLDTALEISNMGIRVDARALVEQLKKVGREKRKSPPFHKMLLQDELPLAIGEGIGRSKICLISLNKAHIGEVQVFQWSDAMREKCKKHNIVLL